MVIRYQLPEYMIPVGGKWQKISESWLQELETSDKRKYNAWDDYISRYQKNPLAFFLPHGRPRKDGGNDGLAFLNDTEHDLIFLIAPEQCGKSIHGAAFMSFRFLPCDKNWPAFTQHGIKYHNWTGPQPIIIASYSWDEVNTVWNTYRKIMPRSLMGPYSPYWGYFKGEHGKPQDLRFHNATKKIRWPCGTEFIFLSYVQSITHWTGKQAKGAHLDEQAPEENVDQVTSRQRTMGNDGDIDPIICTLTGHVVPERPDTGAAGWMKRKVIDQGITKGRKFTHYHIALEDVPDAIMAPSRKLAAKIQWVDEPKKFHNEKKLREGVAKYWGGWEVGGGVALSEWSPDFHLIEPFDIFKYDPTLYRMIDHGQNPCAAGLFAVMPWGDEILFKEYYEYGKNIYDNAAAIVDMCGNERRKYIWEDGTEVWEEVFTKMDFRASELDARSFARKSEESNKTIGRLYNNNGCLCTPTTGKQDKKSGNDFTQGTIPILKDHLAIRKERQHINLRLGRPRDPELIPMGGPKLYVFSTCKNTRSEIESWMGTGDDTDDMVSCVSGDTMIETIEGPIRIKNVKVGDSVLTRGGYKKVLDAGCTNQTAKVYALTTTDGKVLIITGNHPVYVQNKGFIRLDNLKPDMPLYSVESILQENRSWQTQNRLCLTESCIEDIRNQKCWRIENTLNQIQCALSRVSNLCIEKFGSLFTVIFPKAWRFITKTEMPATIKLKIWNVFLRWNITANIPKFTHQKESRSGTKVEMLGINHKKASNGIMNMDLPQRNIFFRLLKYIQPSVCNVEKNINLKAATTEVNFVLEPVAVDIIEQPKDMATSLEKNIAEEEWNQRWLQRFANIAEKILKLTRRITGNSVQCSVRKITEVPIKIPVYNLTIQDCPEYFANGVLVHNCLKYFCARERPYLGDYGKYEVKEDVKPDSSSITGY